MIEKHAQIFSRSQALRIIETSSPSILQVTSSDVSIDRPCKEYSGNTIKSIEERFERAFVTILQIFSVCASTLALVFMSDGNWSCITPIVTPLGDGFKPPKPPKKDIIFQILLRESAKSRVLFYRLFLLLKFLTDVCITS